MGTRAVLSTWSETRAAGLQDLERLLRPLEETEAQLSTWRPDSEVSRLNASTGRGAFALSPSLCSVMETVAEWIRETAGAFDPSIGALVAAWDLHGRGRVPGPAEMRTARSRSGWKRVTFERAACTMSMPAGMSLDVGAFGKGAALDRARAAFQSTGAGRERPPANGNAAWLIDLGGQIAVSGGPPGAPGWDVTVAHPSRRDAPVLQVRIADGSLATSAGSERDVRVGTRRIGHILDPSTGQPAAFTGSTTVWHPEALAADILSTALFVMGPEKGIAWAEARNVAVLYLVPDAGGIVTSRRSRPFSARFQ